MIARHATSSVPTVRSLLTVAAAMLLAPAAALAQAGDFSWNGNVPQGATVRVFTFSGTVTVRAASGSETRISGTARNARENEIEFVSSRSGNDVLVCAMHDGAECTENGIRHDRGWRRDSRRAEASFTIEVPRGVHVRLGSGSGDVIVEGVTADVHASSGSGDVRVGSGAGQVRASSGSGSVTVDGALGVVHASTGSGSVRITTARGPVTASTGSGSIDVSMAALPAGEDMRFSTGSGSITLRLPADFAADVHATTGSGDFETDFPMTLSGRMNRHSVRGTIGAGGRNLRLSTGSGDIRILRQSR